jgi:hypothetical protein
MKARKCGSFTPHSAVRFWWGSFDLGEPESCRKDVPKAQVHILEAGHFALDTAADEIAMLVHEFMKTQK